MDPRVLEIEGWMHEVELEWLYAMAKRIPEKSLIVEIGAWMGRSSCAIYTGAGTSKTVVSIDTWQGNPGEMTDVEIAKAINSFNIYKTNCSIFDISSQNYLDRDTDKGIFYLRGGFSG